MSKHRLSFRVNLPDHPCSKRGILSTIFSIYYRFFVTSPVVINAKRIFQMSCFFKLSWDEELPDNLKHQWRSWRNQVSTNGILGVIR